MKDFTVAVKHLGFQLCGVYLLDSQVLSDPSKYLGGCLSALSTMLQLEMPHVNVLSKMDLVKGNTSDDDDLDDEEDSFICPDMTQLLEALSLTAPQMFYRLNQVCKVT